MSGSRVIAHLLQEVSGTEFECDSKYILFCIMLEYLDQDDVLHPKKSTVMLKPDIVFLSIGVINLESVWSKISLENIKHANVE